MGIKIGPAAKLRKLLEILHSDDCAKKQVVNQQKETETVGLSLRNSRLLVPLQVKNGNQMKRYGIVSCCFWRTYG